MFMYIIRGHVYSLTNILSILRQWNIIYIMTSLHFVNPGKHSWPRRKTRSTVFSRVDKKCTVTLNEVIIFLLYPTNNKRKIQCVYLFDSINRINNNYNYINSTQIKVTTYVVWKLENENYASTYQDHINTCSSLTLGTRGQYCHETVKIIALWRHNRLYTQ